MAEVIEVLERYKTVNGFNTKVIAILDDKKFNYLFIKSVDDKIEVGYTWEMGCKPKIK